MQTGNHVCSTHTHKVRKERSQSAEVMSEGRMEERERKCSSAFTSTLRLQLNQNLDEFSEKMKLHPAHSSLIRRGVEHWRQLFMAFFFFLLE